MILWSKRVFKYLSRLKAHISDIPIFIEHRPIVAYVSKPKLMWILDVVLDRSRLVAVTLDIVFIRLQNRVE